MLRTVVSCLTSSSFLTRETGLAQMVAEQRIQVRNTSYMVSTVNIVRCFLRDGHTLGFIPFASYYYLPPTHCYFFVCSAFVFAAGKVSVNPRFTTLNYNIGDSFYLPCNIELGENTAQTDYNIRISRHVVFRNHTNLDDEEMTYRHNRDPAVVTWNTTATFYKFYSSNLTLHVQNFSIPDPENVQMVKYTCSFSVVLSTTLVNSSITKVIPGFSKLLCVMFWLMTALS